jgi:hypothetical protein
MKVEPIPLEEWTPSPNRRHLLAMGPSALALGVAVGDSLPTPASAHNGSVQVVVNPDGSKTVTVNVGGTPVTTHYPAKATSKTSVSKPSGVAAVASGPKQVQVVGDYVVGTPSQAANVFVGAAAAVAAIGLALAGVGLGIKELAHEWLNRKDDNIPAAVPSTIQ